MIADISPGYNSVRAPHSSPGLSVAASFGGFLNAPAFIFPFLVGHGGGRGGSLSTRAVETVVAQIAPSSPLLMREGSSSYADGAPAGVL